MRSPVDGRVATSRVRMVAEPASVPAVRRFVDDTLRTWGRVDILDDVALSATELATNATLHSQSDWFDVEIVASDGAVRVAVVDGGSMPAHSIAARTAALREAGDADVRDVDAESMTGRGLFIVAALADDWGIDDVTGGTSVWADFVTSDVHDRRAPRLSAAPEPPDVAAGRPVVQLLGCPPELLLAHEKSLGDVARDLRLFASSHDDGEAAASADEIANVARVAALTWSSARVQALEAVREGRGLVDIELAVSEPDDLPRKIAAVDRILARADELARDGTLMTLPATPELRQWREWLSAEMTEQVTTSRAPRSFEDFRAAR